MVLRHQPAASAIGAGIGAVPYGWKSLTRPSRWSTAIARRGALAYTPTG
jgi:hypothetical protein